MAFGRRKSDAQVEAEVDAHHRSARRKVLGYLIILVAVFVGVMLALAFISPTKITVR